MRSPWLAAFSLFVLVLFSVQTASARGGNLLVLRQDDPSPSRTANLDDAEATTGTQETDRPVQTEEATEEEQEGQGEDRGTDISNREGQDNNSTESSTESSEPSPTTMSLLPSATLDANSTSFNSTLNGTMAAPGELPLPPEITPALSVAGVFLLLSGVVYCLIGIKNKWIQIFISSAYLTSLAILVLILYIMKPPVTNGVQGAYLAGIIAPALILGAGSLVFRDVTEGLGCAIGGFCLSMFFLVLKPGGTIDSQAGTAIFIGVFTAVSFAFSFSRYTRSYGIIGSTALGGSTAVILGIDCFSRAGLKEFWVWIWRLNDDLFPLLQDTYPITRGIRVEIAGIVVFTFFGILSQLKIWKVIQARRERKEQERIDANKERDELEAQIGRDVEAGNNRDRGQWESIYGEKDKNHTPVDSGIGTESGSTRKGSMSTYTKEVTDSYEMQPLESPKLPGLNNHGDLVVVSVGEDDWGMAPSVKSKAASLKDGPLSVKASSVKSGVASGSGSGPTSPVLEGKPDQAVSKSVVTSEPVKKSTASKRRSLKPSSRPGPPVVPLPFKIPEDNKEDDNDVESNATFNDSEQGEKRYSQRFSGLRLMRKLSGRSKRDSQASIQTSSSVEALVDNSVYDKSEQSSMRRSSRSNSFVADGIAVTGTESPKLGKDFDFETDSKDKPEASPEADKDSTAEGVSNEKKEIAWQPLTLDNLLGDKSTPKTNDSPKVEKTEKTKAVSANDKAPSTESAVYQAPPAPVTELKSHLPTDQPKVVLQYRTNEWAKHLANAEAPENEEIRVAETAVEEPTQVNPRSLLQTALTAEPKPAPLPPKSPKSTKSSVKSKTSSSPMPGQISSHALNHGGSPTLSPSTSMSSLNDPNNSRTSLPSQSGRRVPSAMALRSTSSPLLSTPIDEDSETSFHTPLPNETLLATRSQMLQHKSLNGSTGSLLNNMNSSARNTPTPLPFTHMNSTYSTAPSVGSRSETPVMSLDDYQDNMSLSARKAHIQRSSSAASVTMPQQALMLSTAGYSSTRDQPPQDLRRSTTDPALRRASMLAAWRQSIAQDVQRGRPEEDEVQMRREEMWEQHKRDQEEITRRKEAEGGWGRMSRQSKQSNRLSRMSNMSGREMNDAHREVLRRMQAGANKKLKEGDQS